MYGPVASLVRVLVDDLSVIKQELQREYCDVEYVIYQHVTKGGHFHGIKRVDFLLSSRRNYYKVIYPYLPYFVERLSNDISLPFEKRQFRFVRISFREESIEDIKREVLELWY